MPVPRRRASRKTLSLGDVSSVYITIPPVMGGLCSDRRGKSQRNTVVSLLRRYDLGTSIQIFSTRARVRPCTSDPIFQPRAYPRTHVLSTTTTSTRSTAEAVPRRVSWAIEDAIRAEQHAIKRVVCVLFLGQSEFDPPHQSSSACTRPPRSSPSSPSAGVPSISSAPFVLAMRNTPVGPSGPARAHSPAPSRSWDGDDIDVPEDIADTAYLSDPASSVRPSFLPSALTYLVLKLKPRHLRLPSPRAQAEDPANSERRYSSCYHPMNIY
ncbi:hypothetical protein EVG20_g3470 [Dentipellis fragilis]|uniref:Uncharacterized protein n=1 Tax=Dentipellis fragilis TaxID=205917 RepID=A0A4Y9Z5P5_9AGAM|nr:hypothetical protein EVG20_g3470 [Dentipellis fragilis]